MKYKADQLYKDIIPINQIGCTKCKEQQTEVMIDEYEAARIFFKKGWRRTERHCYCPKCAKKHLKTKQP